jgi:hypothetical protein
MASRAGPRSGGAGAPANWPRFAINHKISRRGFLLGSAVSPLAAEAAFAGNDDACDTTIEFDLSPDGSKLNIREFPIDLKERENPRLHWSWETRAGSYGAEAWFDIVLDPNDDEKKSVWVREARWGGAAPTALEFEFRHFPLGASGSLLIGH